MDNHQLFSPSGQCSSTPVGFSQGFLNSLRTLENPPYSPDLQTASFYLFPPVKSALKEGCFCDAPDIVNNWTEGVKGPSQIGFQECFQHFYSSL